MKTKLSILIPVVFILVLLPALVSPQQLVKNRFENEYEHTQQVIDQATELVTEASAQLGPQFSSVIEGVRKILEQAVSVQQLAAQEGAKQTSEGYLAGIRATLQARELAMKVISILRQARDKTNGRAEEDESLVLRQLEETDDLMAQVRDDLQTSPPDVVESMIESAGENQTRAWEFFRNQQLRPALRLSLQAERSLMKVSDRLQIGDTESQRLENQLRQLELKLEQARTISQTCTNNQVPGLFSKAADLLNEIKKNVQDGQPSRAESSIGHLRGLLQRITNLCSDQGSLQKVLAHVRADADQAAPTIRASGNGAAISLLEDGLTQLQEADNSCQQGDSENCAAHLKAAQMYIQRAKKLAGL